MSATDKRNASSEDVDLEESHCNKKSKLEEDVTGSGAFADFVLDEVLQENSKNKVAFALGHYDGSKEHAVVTVEKTPFTTETMRKMLCGQSKTNLSLKNDIYSTFELIPPEELSGLKASLIYPATQKHIAKYRSQEIHLLQETQDDFKNITLPYLEAESFSIQWVYNILEKKNEADRIIYEDPDPDVGFILLPDMKWDRKQMEDLYLVGIIQQRCIRSLRDLTSDHLPLLKNILNKGVSAIADNFGVPSSKLRIYLHYQPSYYHLHVHFTHLRFEAPGSGVERAHLLTDVIDNIEMNSDYYQRKTLTFTARAEDKLYKKFLEAGRV